MTFDPIKVIAEQARSAAKARDSGDRDEYQRCVGGVRLAAKSMGLIPDPDRFGWVYFMCDERPTVIKIGFSSDLKQRLASARTYVDARMLAAVPAHFSGEGMIHGHLSDVRRGQSEIFEVSQPVVDLIESAWTVGAYLGADVDLGLAPAWCKWQRVRLGLVAALEQIKQVPPVLSLAMDDMRSLLGVEGAPDEFLAIVRSLLAHAETHCAEVQGLAMDLSSTISCAERLLTSVARGAAT